MKNKKNKLFAALALGLLTLSGLANVSAINDSRTLISQSAGAFKEIRNDPFSFIKAKNILLPENFDYIEQMNREFVGDYDSEEKSVYISGDSLREFQEDNN